MELPWCVITKYIRVTSWTCAYVQRHLKFNKRFDKKFVLCHICQIMRLVNKTYLLSTMPRAEHIVDPCNVSLINSPGLWIERRTVTWHSNALITRLLYLAKLHYITSTFSNKRLFFFKSFSCDMAGRRYI